MGEALRCHYGYKTMSIADSIRNLSEKSAEEFLRNRSLSGRVIQPVSRWELQKSKEKDRESPDDFMWETPDLGAGGE